MDLSLAPTDELIGELVKRHDAIVYGAVQFLNGADHYDIKIKHNGHTFPKNMLVDLIKVQVINEQVAHFNHDPYKNNQ